MGGKGNSSRMKMGAAPNRRLHLAGVFSGKELLLFVDGKLGQRKDVNLESVTVAKQTVLGRPGRGQLGEVRISKIARYDKDFTPAKRFEPDADTLALYHFDEGSGDVLKDSSGNGHHGKIVGAKWVKADGTAIQPGVLGGDDRKAAEWVLSIGGRVEIVASGKRMQIAAAKDLPAGAWQLDYIGLDNNTKVTDAGLENIKALTNLTGLGLMSTSVSDAGLEYIKSLTSLTYLRVDYAQVSDAGLIHLKALTNLTHLGLSGKQVSDAGLVHLKALSNLTNLELQSASVSDAGLEHLRMLTNLNCLDLSHTKVSDAGLVHLKTLTKLTTLHLGTTKVTLAGVATLQRALPKCEITGGTVAEWVLSIGGSVTIRVSDKERNVAAVKDLPAESYQTVRVNLDNNMQLSDAGLAYLKRFIHLTDLNLRHTKVSDAGLEHLKTLTKLTTLNLGNTKVSNAGLEHIKTLTGLTNLYLNSTSVSDAGLPHLKTLTNLKELDLSWTQVSDAGVDHLKAMTNLTSLSLGNTKMTPAGVEALRKALPKCEIITDAVPK